MSEKVKANNVKIVTEQKWFYVRCKTFKSHSLNCQTVEPAPTLLMTSSHQINLNANCRGERKKVR